MELHVGQTVSDLLLLSELRCISSSLLARSRPGSGTALSGAESDWNVGSAFNVLCFTLVESLYIYCVQM